MICGGSVLGGGYTPESVGFSICLFIYYLFAVC